MELRSISLSPVPLAPPSSSAPKAPSVLEATNQGDTFVSATPKATSNRNGATIIPSLQPWIPVDYFSFHLIEWGKQLLLLSEPHRVDLQKLSSEMYFNHSQNIEGLVNGFQTLEENGLNIIATKFQRNNFSLKNDTSSTLTTKMATILKFAREKLNGKASDLIEQDPNVAEAVNRLTANFNSSEIERLKDLLGFGCPQIAIQGKGLSSEQLQHRLTDLTGIPFKSLFDERNSYFITNSDFTDLHLIEK